MAKVKTTISKEEEAKVIELITRRQRQIIVHSYLYYKLDETIIPDTTFDAWYFQLLDLQKKYHDIAKKAPYWCIAKQFDETGSGYFIKKYPPELIGQALIVLDYVRKMKT